MSIITDYYFNKLGRIGTDISDNTERNTQNSKFSNYALTTFFTNESVNEHKTFANNQHILFNGNIGGKGLNGQLIDYDSELMLKTTNERYLETLNLNQRTYLTIPYLGKGSVDPVIESKLLCGENSSERKSVSTVMDKNFHDYQTLHRPDNNNNNAHDMNYAMDELPQNDWVRGGKASRRYSDDAEKKGFF